MAIVRKWFSIGIFCVVMNSLACGKMPSKNNFFNHPQSEADASSISSDTIAQFHGLGRWTYEDAELKNNPNAVYGYMYGVQFGTPNDQGSGDFYETDLDAYRSGTYQLLNKVGDQQSQDGSSWATWNVDFKFTTSDATYLHPGIVCVNFTSAELGKHLMLNIGQNDRPTSCIGINYNPADK